MIFDGFDFAIQYGLAGILSMAVTVTLFLHWRLEKRVAINSAKIKDINTGDDNLANVCEVRKGDLKKLFNRTDTLEKSDLKFEGDIKIIKGDITYLKSGIDEVKRDLKTVLNHFATKGMG